MAVVTHGFDFQILTIFVAFVAIAMAFFKRKFQYWKTRGIELEPPIIPIGNLKDYLFGKRTPHEMFTEVYKKAKAKNLKHCGFYFLTTPSYIPIDPEIIKCILLKDFDHFVNHSMKVNIDADPLNGHLFNLKDAKWKEMRAKLNPAFTCVKIKMMFQIFVECGDTLQKMIGDNSRAVDMKEVLGRFSTDIIASCAFGLEANSLHDSDSEFMRKAKMIFEIGTWRKIKRWLLIVLPDSLTNIFGYKVNEKDVELFFMNIVKTAVEYRKKNSVYRKDFLQLLIQIKKSACDGEEEISIEEMTAQCYAFFAAGYESSATTTTLALYELAQNHKIQTQLRNEIIAVLARYNGKLSYKAILEMPYLDRVVKETLRIYPPLPALLRECNKEYKVPGTDLVLEKGTEVAVPVMGLHTDAEYFPNPEKFDPERFSDDEKRKRHPFTYLPFGEGPRICIGMRFGQLAVKIGVLSLVKNYEIKLNSKTTIPIVYDQNRFLLHPKDGIWLDFGKI